MQILNSIEELAKFVDEDGLQGCLADSSFLYAFSFDDDRIHGRANEIFEWLAENEVGIYANVISRMEFVDLIFRKQITLGAIKFFGRIDPATKHRNVFNFL